MVFGVALTGCITIKKKTTETTNLGGVFVTEDRFETWKHSSLMMTPGETPGSIGDVDVLFMKFDPSDNNAMYLGTRRSGMFYSYNSGKGWSKASTLPDGLIRDLAIDPDDKCTLYVGLAEKIYKSDDCSRTWESVWFSDDGSREVAAMAVDWYDSNIVYAGLTDGSLLKSSNKGETWDLLRQFKNRVHKISIDPNDSRTVYVMVSNIGMYRTPDKGENWKNLNAGMKDFDDSNQALDFVVAKEPKDMLLYASSYGILKSLDGGETWAKVNLNTLKGEERIYDVAIDLSNSNYIYYSTDRALYKSLDGGESWANKKMPTTRVASELLIHPEKGNRIFMAVKEPPAQ